MPFVPALFLITGLSILPIDEALRINILCYMDSSLKTMILTKWKWIAAIVGIAFILFITVIYVILLNYDYNSLTPRITQAVKDATGRDLTLGGGIRVKIGLTPTLVAQDVTFGNAAWGSQPEMVKIKRTEIKVRLFPLLSRQLKIIRLVLVEPEILLETDAAGRSNLDFGTRRGEFLQTTFKKIQIEKGRITYINHGQNKKYTADVDTMTASAPGSAYGPVQIKAKGSYNGEHFDVEGTAGSLAAFEKPSAAWPVKLTIHTGFADFALDGSIDNPTDMRGIKLNFSLKGKDLAGFTRLFGELPRLQGPFDISGQVSDTGHKAYSISNLKILQGTSDLYGSMNLDLAGKQPMVKAQLAATKLDLRPHIQAGPSERKTSAGKGKVLPNTPLHLEALSTANAEVRLQAAEIITQDFQLNNFDANMVLKNGVLNVSSLKAGLGKGSVDGKLSLEQKEKTALLTLTMKLAKVEINSLGRVIKAVRGVEGKLDADIDIRARGSTVAGLLGGSSGKAVFLMGRGNVNNRYIDELGGGLGSAVFRLLNPFEKEKPYTAINCFVGAFTITNGLARATTLVLNTQYMVVVGEGTINLGTERLNLFLKPVPKQSIGASLINRLGIGELTKPLKLTGTLADPALTIDPTQTAIIIGKTIGSMTLFGPAGIAAALVGGESDNETSCVAAASAARKGVKVEKGKGVTGEVQEKAGETIKGVGEKLKGLFGK